MTPPRPKAIVSWSSGKDSAFAVQVIRERDDFELVGVITTITDAYARVSMHGVRESVLDRQVIELGLPCRKIRIPAPCPNQVYEQLMTEVMQHCLRDGVDHVVFGDLFLRDLRDYRERNLATLGMHGVFPLWGRDTASLSRAMVDAGLRAIITCVDPRVVPRELAGRTYDHRFLDELPDSVDPCGENGEFHSVVIAGPMLREPLDSDKDLRMLDGHYSTVRSVAFSPDGTQLASAGQDKLVLLWDVGSGNEIRLLDGHEQALTSVAFSPDGTQLATGSFDRTVVLWDVATGAEVRRFDHEREVWSVAFSPDGTILASGCGDNTVKLWDVASGNPVRILAGHGNAVVSVVFSASGAQLASASADNTIKLWDVETGLASATLFGAKSGDWVIATPDGGVDGSPGEDGGEALIYWQVGDVQLPGFVGWQRYHTPGLLGEVMKGDAVTAPPSE